MLAAGLLAKKAVEQEGYYIGVGLGNLIMMFCPDVIALGGGVMNSAHLFMDRVRQVVRQNCTLVPAAKTELLMASMGADTGLAGAARAWYNRFGPPPTGAGIRSATSGSSRSSST